MQNIFLMKLKSIDEKLIIKENEPMKNHTSFKVGGPVDLLLVPSSSQRLAEIISEIQDEGRDYVIIGKGSNLIVSDKGIRSIVIKTTGLTEIKRKGLLLIGDSGVNLAKMASFACESSLGGMEFASGIPGTLGGAVSMNAGAYNGEMKDIVDYTEYLNKDGEVLKIDNKAHMFEYRKSIFQRNECIILRTALKLEKAEKEDIRAKMTELNKRRKEKQPLEMPCAGSVFKRPEGNFAGKLIEDAGLKGYRIGGAMVSDKHCGFIVNTGNATAADITELIEYVHNKVKKRFNIELEKEVKIIGEV